jgi:hypothetical protein
MTFHPKGIASNAQLATSGAQFTSISKSMADLGIPWLDILKIDIEGHEWSSFLEMLEGGLPMPFTQILIGNMFFNLLPIPPLLFCTFFTSPCPSLHVGSHW